MPIDSQHPSYSKRKLQWTRCRDAYDGTDAIKAKGKVYLPQLKGQSDTDYEKFKSRAVWYNATRRTVNGMVGLVFRKPMMMEGQDGAEELFADVTMNGRSLDDVGREALTEILKVGRYGVLVDMQKATDPRFNPQARSYIVPYMSEDILNWRYVMVEGQRVLALLVLREHLERQGRDEFETEQVQQFREFRLTEDGVLVRVWQQVEKDLVVVDTAFLSVAGEPVSRIPFVCMGAESMGLEPDDPPLLDLVDMNLSHYRSSADLEDGRFYTARPIIWAAGFPIDVELNIGQPAAWRTDDANARAGILEFQGQGLQALEKALEEKEDKMAILGSQLLEDQKKSVERAETIEMRHAGKNSVLSSVAEIVDKGLTKAGEFMLRYMQRPEEAFSVQTNKDFFPRRMTGEELVRLVEAWQQKAFSYQTLYWLMEQGEITRPNVDAEEEQALIEEENPEPEVPELPGFGAPGQPVADDQDAEVNR